MLLDVATRTDNRTKHFKERITIQERSRKITIMGKVQMFFTIPQNSTRVGDRKTVPTAQRKFLILVEGGRGVG